MLGWLDAATEPSQHELLLSGPAIEHFWVLRDQLQRVSDVLYYRWEEGNAKSRLLLLVPGPLVPQILKHHHDNKTAGHFSFEKTYDKIKRHYIWYRMRLECELYTRQCIVCTKNKKTNRIARAGLGAYHAGAPMERVHLDILGPFVPSLRGNQYVLVLVDQFTKWVECYPLPVQNAVTIERAVVAKVACYNCTQIRVGTSMVPWSKFSVTYCRSPKLGPLLIERDPTDK